MLKSLRETVNELTKYPGIALCLHHDSKNNGLLIEVRGVDDGELLSQPITLTENIVLESKDLDILDTTCARIVKRVRESRQGINRPFTGMN